MHSLLAYAETPDGAYMSSVMVLWAVLIIAGTAVAGFVLIFISRKRRHGSTSLTTGRRADLIMAGTFFWGLITAGSLLYTEQQQMNWTKEYTTRIESGYFDPKDTSDTPRLPWGIWTGLGVVYAAMLFWALSGKRAGEAER